MTDRERKRQEMRAEVERRRDHAFTMAPSWRTRARRRALVALVVAIVLAAVVWAHLYPYSLTLPAIGLFAVILLMIALRLFTRAVAETPRSQLDERDRELRDAAWRSAYVITLVAIVALVAYIQITADQPDVTARALVVGAALVLGSISAPTLALAWALADDDPADVA